MYAKIACDSRDQYVTGILFLPLDAVFWEQFWKAPVVHYGKRVTLCLLYGTLEFSLQQCGCRILIDHGGIDLAFSEAFLKLDDQGRDVKGVTAYIKEIVISANLLKRKNVSHAKRNVFLILIPGLYIVLLKLYLQKRKCLEISLSAHGLWHLGKTHDSVRDHIGRKFLWNRWEDLFFRNIKSFVFCIEGYKMLRSSGLFHDAGAGPNPLHFSYGIFYLGKLYTKTSELYQPVVPSSKAYSAVRKEVSKIPCPVCGNMLVKKNNNIFCSSCDYKK